MTSAEYRNSILFLRNGFESRGRYGIPLVKKQSFTTEPINLIACSDTRCNDKGVNKNNGVHFFVDDYRFAGIYNNPGRSFKKYAQYKFLLSPDYSLYADMPTWKQIENVAKNRWCGAYWQSRGLVVIPSISWSTSLSFEFCFDGVERESTVAIGMIGCKTAKTAFMRGYAAMMEKLSPAMIICFGNPFPEMEGNIISVDYYQSRKVAR